MISDVLRQPSDNTTMCHKGISNVGLSTARCLEILSTAYNSVYKPSVGRDIGITTLPAGSEVPGLISSPLIIHNSINSLHVVLWANKFIFLGELLELDSHVESTDNKRYGHQGFGFMAFTTDGMV